MNVAIIGGGIAGLSVAYHLVRAGVAVDLYEKNANIASECSYANGGQISACNFQTLHTSSNLKKGLSWLFKKDAPLYISPNLDIDKIKWLTGFLSTTLQGKNFANSIKTLDLAMKARQEYSRYYETHSKEDLGQSTAYRGMLRVFDNQKDMDAAAPMMEMIDSYNSSNSTSSLNYTELRPFEIDLPHFNTSIVGGYLFKEDGIADINALCVQMLNKLKTSFLFGLHLKSNITNIEKIRKQNYLLIDDRPNGQLYDKVVIANGWAGDKLSKKFGTTLNLYPVKGYSISIECNKDDVPPDYSLLHDSKKIVSSTFRYPDGRTIFRVAGTMELSTKEEPDYNWDRIEPLVDWAFDNFGIYDYKHESYSCSRPMTPDMMPMYAATKNDPSIFVHNGLGHLGLTLAMGTGKILSDSIIGV